MTNTETKQATTIEVIEKTACAFIRIGTEEPDRVETPELCRTAIEYLTNAESPALKNYDSRITEAVDSDSCELAKEDVTNGDVTTAIEELIRWYADENEPQDKRTHMLRTAVLIAVFHAEGTVLAEQLALVLNV